MYVCLYVCVYVCEEDDLQQELLNRFVFLKYVCVGLECLFGKFLKFWRSDNFKTPKILKMSKILEMQKQVMLILNSSFIQEEGGDGRPTNRLDTSSEFHYHLLHHSSRYPADQVKL